VVIVLSCISTNASAQSLFANGTHWTDHSAHAFDFHSLEGRPTIVTLAYGACRRICSTSLKVMRDVQARADAQHLELNFVVIGLDPKSDTPADWADFRVQNKLERPNWQFLTGSAADVGAVARTLGVRYWTYDGHTMHDFKIALLSPDGKIMRSIDRFDQAASSLLP
jgi:protein SCO1/2